MTKFDIKVSLKSDTIAMVVMENILGLLDYDYPSAIKASISFSGFDVHVTVHADGSNVQCNKIFEKIMQTLKENTNEFDFYQLTVDIYAVKHIRLPETPVLQLTETFDLRINCYFWMNVGASAYQTACYRVHDIDERKY